MKEFVLTESLDPSRCKIDYRGELNEEQLNVVLHGDGPCLVLAGAGSGKTRTITYRVAYLMECGVSPDNILLVTFTNKAAREMLARVETLLCAPPKGLWGGTFHSIANRLLRQYATEVGHTSGFSILDEEDTRDLVKLCLKELAVDTTARRFPSPANLVSLLSYSRNAGVSVREAVERKHPHFLDLVPTLERLADVYAARKRQADAMDFDDLLLHLRDLLRDRPDIRDRLATQFRYVLVDEYQDTNAIQSQIVQYLSSTHGNLLVVGDDAQSIYSFRAADIRNILSFPDMFPEAHVFKLVTNYRSTPQILELANAAIRQNTDQFRKDLRAVREGMELPSVVPAANASQEAQYVAEQILSLRDEGVPLEEVAVLFRAAYLSQSLEFELMRRDIPYEYRGGMKFFQRAHVKDVVAHLRLIVNPRDEIAWMRTLSLQTGVGPATVSTIVESLRAYDTLSAMAEADLPLSARAKRGWESARTLMKKLAAAETSADAIRVVISHGYRDYLEAEYPDFLERLEDLEQFALFAEGYTETAKLLEDVTLADDYGAARGGGSDDKERIVLSTIHQAKGLEWDAVFVIGLTDGKFPNERAAEERNGLEEERRLFYVASTRARKYLFLTYPIMAGHDQFLVGQPSRFLSELPTGLTEEIRLKTRFTPPNQTLRASRNQWDASHDEPTIVLDDMGERTQQKPKPGSFLRDIDEL